MEWKALSKCCAIFTGNVPVFDVVPTVKKQRIANESVFRKSQSAYCWSQNFFTQIVAAVSAATSVVYGNCGALSSQWQWRPDKRLSVGRNSGCPAVVSVGCFVVAFDE